MKRVQIGLGLVLLVGTLAMAIGPAAGAGETGGAAAAARWQASIASVPLPGGGCFSASYPSLAWHATPCATAPNIPFAPGPHAVGDGHDYSAVSSGLVSKATGSFVGVSPKLTETGQYNHQGSQLANVFSLQLNTQFFTTPTCAKSGTPSKCLGWQQFVYDSAANYVFMQYWLIDYNAKCPTGGWMTFGVDCYRNSSAVPFSGASLKAADLATVKLTGSAVKNGKDMLQFSNKGHATAVSGLDSVVNLALKWNTAEFDIFGDGGGGQANLSAKSSLSAQVALTGASKAAPKCVKEGFTAETNNLNLAHTPAITSAPSPTMRSTQSNGPATTASCATAA
ncbi:MAG TPA: hypothetical protein VGO03_05050 [Acidimicrobiia bacterium]|jgi:hypothetical protein